MNKSANLAYELLRIHLKKYDSPVDVDGLRVALEEGLAVIAEIIPVLTPYGESVVSVLADTVSDVVGE